MYCNFVTVAAGHGKGINLLFLMKTIMQMSMPFSRVFWKSDMRMSLRKILGRLSFYVEIAVPKVLKLL